MTQQSEGQETDYREIYAQWDELPQCRIHLDLGDGGENCWGRELPDGTYALDNYPLYRAYRWQDVVRTKEIRTPDELIHRRWNTRIYFRFDQPEDADEASRKIFEALDASDADPGFWCRGVGYVSFEVEMTEKEAEAEVTKRLAGVIEPAFYEDSDEEE